ncbi:hypothetical protein DMN91_008772 [Ooceraea biroi]|uniref:Rhodanese domain-containing protein n=1 Tax=Ooceraea biroi TaxID=2015173 RepID=A0A3L8DD57_OOCBI|nr:ubiquitin carboxyl-terminal hydrolase 8 isoform X1 [Ooceraea biroi]XP_019886555.2 ubiquitin carboxyl-terminal hydrolase 8 isoform X1 [Ooceraea biroi]RLU18415.1 hypothetical protein DMN91_008772 [Ooceraea biroi]
MARSHGTHERFEFEGRGIVRCAYQRERVAVLPVEVRRCSSFATGLVIIRRRKPDMNDPRRYFNESRDRSRSPCEPANITSAFPSRTMTFPSASQHTAPNTSPVLLDSPILRRGSRLREPATMPKEAKLGYTCVNDLAKQARVNYAGKETRSVYQRLPTMRQKSEMAKKDDNDEPAYIPLKRRQNTVEWLKKTQDYKDGKSIYSTSTAKVYTPNSDISLKLPETPTDDPLYGDSDNFISCNQLYSLLQNNNSRYLIIDIRQKAHYDGSKMTFDKCINIPQSEIEPGKLGYKFANCFHKDKQSLDLFKHRSAPYVDVIILVDWNTTQETLTTSNYLNILKTIFEKRGPGTRYNKIKILNGGYQEWLMTYPTFTTNSNVAVPEFNYVTDDTLDFVPIEYLDWSHWDEENEGSTKAQNKPNNAATAVEDMEMDAANAHQFENPDAPAPRHKAPSQNEINANPVIDRSSTPAALKTYDPRCKEVPRFVKELNELAKSTSKLAEELSNQAYALYSQRDEYSARDEQYIRTDLKSLKGKLDEMHEMYLTVENEFNVYCKEADATKFDPDDNEKTNLEFNHFLMKKEIKDEIEDEEIENDWKKLQEAFFRPRIWSTVTIPGPSRAAPAPRPVPVHPPPIRCQLPTGEQVAVPYFTAVKSRKFRARTANGLWVLRFDRTGKMTFCRHRAIK